MIILWTAGLFLSGSLMFSYWLGVVNKKNITSVGDGNPGALNLWKSSGYKLGIAGIVLDFCKGYVPVFWVIEKGAAHGYSIIPLAVAPIAGHAFSPFLKGKGGKAIAVTFGVWSALTGFEVSLAYAVILAVLKATGLLMNRGKSVSTEADGVQVVGGMLVLSVYLVVRSYSAAIWWVWFGNCALLAYTHRAELAAWLKSRAPMR